jgi:mRNA-degrading endonuclease RelE of RelBE toxin-antitoxin system
MEIAYTKKFISLYEKLPNEIKKKAQKQEKFFRNNMFYVSLNTEKLMPKDNNIWSFRVDYVYRVVFHFEKNKITFLYIGHHKDIYKFV